MANQEANEVKINGRPFRTPQVNVSYGGGWPGKVVTGATDKDSHPTLSTWVMGDWTGGLGIADFKEGVEQSRYRYATLWARHPFQLSLPLQVDKASVAGTVYPIGDDWNGTSYDWYDATATAVHKNTAGIGGVLTRTPRERGVVFQGTAASRRIFVACGNGYIVIDPTAPGWTDVPTPDLKCFAVWDQWLVAVHSDGTLWRTVSATVAFTQIGTVRLPQDAVPYRIMVYRDRNDEQVPVVVTSKGLYVLDPDTPRLYPVPEIASPHPDFGRASCVWGDLYVASGLDVFRWNGSARLQVGLSRDHGLPSHVRGTIVDLIPGNNSMYAIVQRGNSAAGKWAVYEWNESAWHFVCDHALVDLPGAVTWGGITRSTRLSTNAYDLFWTVRGASDQTVYHQLSKSDFNPREALIDGTINFGYFDGTNTSPPRGGYLDTGWFDANMARYPKIANSIELRGLNFGTAVGASSMALDVLYRIDDQTAFTTIATMSGPGPVTVPFDSTGDLTDGIESGLEFERIEFRFRFTGITPAIGYVKAPSPPILESAVLSYVKPNPASRSFTFNPDLSATFYDMSPADTAAWLETTKDTNQFVSFEHRGVTYKCHMLISSGPETAGLAEGFSKTVTLIEIRESLGT